MNIKKISNWTGKGQKWSRSSILYPIKNQKGLGMKSFLNLLKSKNKHPYRMRFSLQISIAEFLQLGIGAELSGMPL